MSNCTTETTPKPIQINTKKGSGKPKPPPSPDNPPEKRVKLTAAEVETDLVAVLDRRPVDAATPEPLSKIGKPFPHDVRVYRKSKNDEICLAEIVENTARLTFVKNVAADLAEYCGLLSGVCKPYNITMKKALQVVERWAYRNQELVPLPRPWGFRSEPEVCFNRLTYDPIHVDFLNLSAHAPMFYSILQRVKNTQAFCAMIGSIFFPEASRKQILWLWGPTGGGKSQLAVLLKALLGTAAYTYDNEDFKDAFWKSSLLDKRTIYIDECDSKFLRGSSFKAVTGSGTKRINPKNKNAFEASINAIFFASSNEPPNIPNDPALISRVVPCWVSPLSSAKIPEIEVQRILTVEAPFIAGYCMKVYKETCPNFEAISFNVKDHLQDSIDNHESEFIEIFEARFKLDPLGWTTGLQFTAVLKAHHLDTPERRELFKEFLRNRFPQIKETRLDRLKHTPPGAGRTRVIAGISLR